MSSFPEIGSGGSDGASECKRISGFGAGGDGREATTYSSSTNALKMLSDEVDEIQPAPEIPGGEVGGYGDVFWMDSLAEGCPGGWILSVFYEFSSTPSPPAGRGSNIFGTVVANKCASHGMNSDFAMIKVTVIGWQCGRLPEIPVEGKNYGRYLEVKLEAFGVLGLLEWVEKKLEKKLELLKTEVGGIVGMGGIGKITLVGVCWNGWNW